MPDLDILAEQLAQEPQPDRNKAPINPEVGYHEFELSEFPEGARLLRCGKCGGGPAAQIHQKPVDQLQRIADALERIGETLAAAWQFILEHKDDE